MHEESLPWLIASILPLSATVALQDMSPMFYSASFELAFLTYCSAKVLLRFNKPTTPHVKVSLSLRWLQRKGTIIFLSFTIVSTCSI